tara:strand:- start:39 stop:320 length:282 start_codon:yes stop_codon:yes gene_type:complete
MNKLVNGKLVTVSSEEETLITSEEAKVLADDAVNGYKKERTVGTATTTGYIDVTEQLDQLYRDMKAGKLGVGATTGEWFVGISSVKTAFPKPS